MAILTISHRVLVAVGIAVSLSGCVDPARRAADQRFADAASRLPPADRAECELVTRMRSHSGDDGFFDELVKDDKVHTLCLKTKLYRAGYVER
jgi:hypothetical protein